MNSKLKKEFERSTEKLVDKFVNSGLQDTEVYKFWLAQKYFQTKNNDQALNFIYQCAPEGSAEKERWLEHTKEEKGHYKLALRDLQNLGGNINDYVELNENKVIYQRQWYIAKELGTSACLGWILGLEGCASGIGKRSEFVETMYKNHGKKGMSFLKLHIEEDDDHLESAFKVIEQLDDQSKELIIENMIASCEHYISLLDKIALQSKEEIIAA